ncbi:E3 ubiquitin-protein ligase hyd-like [Neodiprion virginianus]|uniref:E3 ubiquitin-protein ligase hyd-like n=1 Tax=Neodiprion virginianus TaxID=2961670 RepID=UPI001EE6CCE7|nr:E3 ubiquitin-protein ligase hyd-like [Neodiprion virginianus]
MVVSTDISYGTHVCMKNRPMYQPGAIGFTIANGVSKVSQLLLAAWNLDSTYRFKILPAGSLHTGGSADKRESNGNASASGSSKSNHKETADRSDMPPPLSPASSTCSDTGSITTNHIFYLSRYFVPSFLVLAEIRWKLRVVRNGSDRPRRQ